MSRIIIEQKSLVNIEIDNYEQDNISIWFDKYTANKDKPNFTTDESDCNVVMVERERIPELIKALQNILSSGPTPINDPY